MLKGKAVIVHGFEEFPERKGCIELRRGIRGIAGTHVAFPVAVKEGGQVLGVMKAKSLVGFTLSFSPQALARSYFFSNIVAVPPEHQNRDIGQLLEVAQPNEAGTRGINHIAGRFELQARESARGTDHKSLSSSRALPQGSLEEAEEIHSDLRTGFCRLGRQRSSRGAFRISWTRRHVPHGAL